MATGMFGANPDRLRETGGALHAAGEALDRAGIDLRREIDGVEWVGPDADAYRDSYRDRLRIDFGDLAERLRGYRDELERQADAQDEASEAGGDEGCLQSTWDGVSSLGEGIFGDGLWGDVQGLASLVGFDENWNWSWDNLGSTWSGMGVLAGYNPHDGSWGNWGLAGEAWTGLGKDMLAWDMWSQDPARAFGTALWNVGTIPLAVGKVGKVGTVGNLLDGAADVGRIADGAADVGRIADDVAGVGRVADDVGGAGRVADDAAGASSRSADNAARGASRWSREGSPDVPPGSRVDGGDANKLGQHHAPYDTGAIIDPATGNLVSTSGRTFSPDDVSHHYTTTTGRGDPSLRVSTEPGTTPFTPEHRYVLDNGKTVIETDALGRPDYTRYTMDGRAERADGSLSSDPYRAGQQTRAADWPDALRNEGDQRGHGVPAQHRGPNEDLNTVPQSPSANSAQARVENAVSDAYARDPASGPFVVERRVTYGNDGHAASYGFTVSDNAGNPVSVVDKRGQPVPLSFND